jgi:hypothetical protein
MRGLLRSATWALLVLGTASPAAAIDRHDQVAFSPVKRGAQTIGFDVSLTLYPETYSRVRISLGRAGKGVRTTTGGTTKRELAAGTKRGYIRLQLADLKRLKKHQSRQVKYRVLYGRKNTLRAGQEVDVVTAWGGNGYWHVFGMTNGPVMSGPTYPLPR